MRLNAGVPPHRVHIAGRWRRCWGRVGETGFVCSRTPRLFGFDDEVLAHVPISGMMVVEECGELGEGHGAERKFFGFTVQGTPMSRTEVCARGGQRHANEYQMEVRIRPGFSHYLILCCGVVR